MESFLLFIKKNCKQLIFPVFLLLGFSTLFAQTEDFEGETVGGTSFTVGGFLFNVDTDLMISQATNFSCGAVNPGTNTYLDTGFGDGPSSGVVGSITPDDPAVTFEVSTTVAQCAWTGESDGNNNLDGTIRITGTKTDNTTISEDFLINTTIPDDELVPFTFSAAIWAGQMLKSIQIELVSPAGVEYVAIDNFVFETISSLFVCPTVGAVSASETSVCVNDPFNITATGLNSMDMATNSEQDFGIEFVYFNSATADPYTGGTSLGTVPFGSLTAGGTVASLVGATIPVVDPTGFIYAILSPAPTNATCRPSAVTTIATLSLPPVDVTLPETYCEDAGVVTAGPLFAPSGNAVYSGTGVTDNGDGVSFQFDIPTVGVGVHPVTATITNANGCQRVEVVNITVLALPTVAFTAPADLCLNDGVQTGLGGGTPPEGTVTGDMGLYSGTGVTDDGNGMTYSFDPAAAGVGTHTITYTYTDENGCTNSAMDDVEVFAVPNAMFTAPADLCLNAGVQAGLGGGTPTGGVYSGAGVTDDGNGMTYSFDPAAAGVGTHTITYTVGVSGCTDMAMDDIEVFALPNVTMVINPAGDLCANSSTQLYSVNGMPTGGVYSGTGVTNIGDGINYTFNPAVAGVGTHTITYTFTDANGCSASATDDITVLALPTVAFTAPADLCVNAGVQAGLGGGTPPEGSSTGDMGLYSGTGVTDDGNGMTYSFDPAAAGVGTHTITYTYTDGNGCTNSASDDVEVFAVPNAMFTAPPDVCLTDVPITGLGGGTPTGGVYSGAGVTDDGNGMTYSFDPAAAGVGTHTITYTVGVSGCIDMAMDDIEVFALPNVTMEVNPAGDLCANSSTQLYSANGMPTGGVYSGTGVTNIGDGLSYTFNPAVAGVGTHTITYTFTDGNGCTNSASDDITVLALPTVTFTAPADLCINAGVQTGLGGGTPPEGTVTGDMGLYSGTGVTDDGNGMTYSFDPAAAGVGTHTITYTYTDDNGCTNSAMDDIEVFALPNVTFTALADLCVNAGVQTGLGGGTPPEGTATGDMGVYSGTGVTDDGNGMTYSFDPAAAGVGTHTITYTYTDENGCSAFANDDVEVFAAPTIDVTLPETYCADAGVVTAGPLFAPSGGAVYSGTGVTDNGDGVSFQFDIPTVGAGVHPVTATITNANGCQRVEVVNITVLALPTVVFTASADLCIDAGVQTGLGGGTPPEGTVTGDMGVYSGTGVTDDGNGMTYSFDPAVAGVGTHTLTYTYTDENGCTNSVSDDIEVFALPNVTFTAPAPDVCVEDPVVTGLGGGMPTGGVYSGIGVTDDGNGMTFSFDPTAAAPNGGNITVTYTFTDVNGCTSTANDDIFVNPICCLPPTISCAADNFDLPPGCNPTVPAGVTTFNVTGGSTPNPAWPTVTDGCEPLTLTFTDATVDVGCIRTVTRTYRITDDNGDFAECDQLFTFSVDTDGPTLSMMPTNVTVECDAIPAVEDITATDNCESIEPVLFINEIHYDNASTDVGEFLEIAGTAGIDLSNYEVYAYEDFDGQFDSQVQLSGIIPNEGGSGFGAIAFTRTELPTGFFENGPNDGIALVEIATGTVIKFISYEGTVTASNGPASGMTSEDIGVEEGGATPVGESLQLQGMNGCPCTDFTWSGPSAESPGLINTGQSFDISACPSTNAVPVQFNEVFNAGSCANSGTIMRTWTATDDCGNTTTHTQTITVEDTTMPEFCNAPEDITVDCEAPDAEELTATDNCDFSGMSAQVWVNEFHYDNTGTDTGEFIEIAGVSGTDLTGYQLVTYNGANGQVDDVYDLSGVIDEESCGRGALSFATPGLQNGSPDGFAFVGPDGSVLEFLSYEGSFTAVNGAAMGMSSTDVGVSEPGTTPVGFSLQLTGTASSGGGFSWSGPSADSPGSLNTDQNIQGNLVASLEELDNTSVCEGGTIERIWTVMDACGNVNSHTQTITVNPAPAPEITCPADQVVTCFEDINADPDLVMATSQCGDIVEVYVKQPLISGIPGCDGTVYTYIYVAVDDCGKSSECEQQFLLQNSAPTIDVPAGGNVECFEDIEVSEGDATVTTDCAGDFTLTVLPPTFSGPASCPGTEVTYVYRVKDFCGRIVEASRVFTITNPIGPIITSVPPDYTTSCNEGFGSSPELFEAESNCGGLIELEVSDPVVNGTLGCSGSNVQYTYTARDECGRTAVHIQTISFINEGPVIDCPETLQIFNCQDGDTNHLIEAWIASVTATSSCGGAVNVSNNFNGNPGLCLGNNFTNVTFFATDECGQTTSCVGTIIITDTEAPIIFEAPQEVLVPCNAVTEQIFEEWLSTQGGAEAIDGCWGEDISWTTNPVNPQLNCAGGPQAIVVEFIATDGCGNSSSVTGIFNTKLPPNTINISGNIQREDAEAVANVQIGIEGGTAGIPDMDYTEEDGAYGIPELDYEENLSLVPYKNDDLLNGVSTYDLVLLHRHILNIDQLDSPYKRIAADINKSGSISTLDILLLRRAILFIDDEFMNNTSWRFVDADFVFPNAEDPFATSFPEVYSIEGIEEEIADFIAVKIGDLNLDSWTSSLMGEPTDRSGLGDLRISAKDELLKAGERYEIELHSQNFSGIEGFQFTMNYDESEVELIELEGLALSSFEDQHYGMVKPGVVTLSWNEREARDISAEEAMIRVVLVSKTDVMLSEVLSISSDYTRAEAYQGGELLNVLLEFEEVEEEKGLKVFELYQNEPNPFKLTTMIGFSLPESGLVEVKIYDVSGRIVYSMEGNYASGYNRVEIDRGDLPSSGIFYYRVSTANESASKKMILIEK